MSNVSSHMATQAHLPILNRVGGVLLTVGVIDIATLIYCIANDISYSSSFNIFAVVAGIFLLRGSLRAASLVRWFSAFMFAGFASLVVVWPFMQPLDLTLTQLRLYPRHSVATIALIVGVFALLAWVLTQLGRQPVQIAIAALGRKRRDLRIAAAAGVVLVAIVGLCMFVLLGGESAARARSIAQQQLGSGYRFHVTSMSIETNNERTSVSGVVTAWNANEIKHIPVQWEER